MIKPYYDKDGITIYHGDCRQIIPQLDKVDLVVTDPPYGINIAKNGKIGGDRLAAVTDFGVPDWDVVICQDGVDMALGHSVWQIVFGGNYYTMPPSPCWLVWDKDNTGDFADCELAWTNFKKPVRKFKWRWNGMLQQVASNKEKRGHPTQKPVPLMRWCIGQASESKTILDPFMGSGSTLIAAKQMKKKCIGIEKSEEFCEVAAKRLSKTMRAFS